LRGVSLDRMPLSERGDAQWSSGFEFLAGLVGIQLRWPAEYRDFVDAVLADDEDPLTPLMSEDEGNLKRYSEHFFNSGISAETLRPYLQLTQSVAVAVGAVDESASEDEDYIIASAATVREHNKQELVEALLGQGYIKSRNSDIYALPRNPDFRVKFGKTVVRFEVRAGDAGYGRPWQLGSSYLLTKEHGTALRTIRSPRQMIEKSLRGLGSSREEQAKRLAPRNADLKLDVDLEIPDHQT
jgi:hypothetical protein